MLDNEILRRQLISRRAFLIGGGKVGLLSLLASKLLYMQLFKKDEYKTLSDKNRINLLLVAPMRGKIFDSSGILLATNKPCFRLMLDKSLHKNYQEQLGALPKILECSEDEYSYILKKVKNAAPRMPIMIADQLSWSQIAAIEEHKLILPSLFIDVGQARFYPEGEFAAHLLGYVGQISTQDALELGVNNISGVNVGKAGIEKYYEKNLRGQFGYKKMEVNAFGKYVRELSSENSLPGEDLHLNIDIKLQAKIWPYLHKTGCSAIAMDNRTGQVKLLASTPGFQPNNFTKLSPDYWRSLLNDSYKPLINKTVQNNYSPGSPFKIITVLAALESGIDPSKTCLCTGASFLGTNSFRCHKKGGHGTVNMVSAIKYSCNTYMYETAKLIGADKILEVAKKFGFGSITGIDMPSEARGFLPSRSWKKSQFKTNWSLGDSLNLSIGQGFILATPIQIARFVAAIASDGKLFTPQVIANAKPKFQQIDVKQEHLKIIKEAMYQAVNTPGGTGYYSRIIGENREIAGKTGTVQVQAKSSASDDLSRESVAWDRRNHAVFVGFGPYHDPKYSVMVFVDHGGAGGRAASPIASRILNELI